MKKSNRAFTLVELLVVISIIGLLSSVILAALVGARDKGRVAGAMLFADNNYHALGADAIGYWNFNEVGKINDNPALDLSGHGLTLIPGGSSAISRSNITPTGSGNSLWITTNLGQYVTTNSGTTPSATLLALNLRPLSITVSAWIYFNSYNSGFGFINIGANSQTVIKMATLSGSNAFSCGGSDMFTGISTSNSSFGTIETGKWHHVACSVNGTTGIYTDYFDGKKIDQVSGAGGSPSFYTLNGIDLIQIGDFSQTQKYSAFIDDVAVYSQSLTSSEIHEIYAEQAPEHMLARNAK